MKRHSRYWPWAAKPPHDRPCDGRAESEADRRGDTTTIGPQWLLKTALGRASSGFGALGSHPVLRAGVSLAVVGALLAGSLIAGSGWAEAGTVSAVSAVESYGPPAQASSADDEAHWRLLRAELKAGRLQQARALCLEALRARPDSVRYLRTLTGIELKLGRCPAGLEAMQKALKRAPHAPDLLYESALVSLECGGLGDGIHTLRLLLLMNPQEPRVLFQLGKALLQTPDLSEALEHLERHASLRPQDAAGLRALAYGQILLARFEEAQDTIDRARSLEPESWETDYYQGALDLEREANDSAEKFFRAALQGNPSHGPSHLGLGKVLLKSGRFQDALEALRDAGRLLPQRADVHFQLSRAYSRLGRNEEARRQIELFREKRRREEEALRPQQTGQPQPSPREAETQQPPPQNL
ncbi:MAG TPA: tetratricopeptide repeat protein [Acidobacteriota bacterium]|nr:tetratricopeptide repeat protein [Acidobacteriota bacterium]